MAKDVLVAGHAVNQSLSSLISTLERPELYDRSVNLDNIGRAIIDRSSMFARQIKSLLADLSASELSLSLLDGVNSGIIHCNNEISQFISNGNINHLSSASSNLDTAIASASQAFFKRPSKYNRAYSEAIETVQSSAQKAIEKVRSKSEALEGLISQFEVRVSEQVRANEESRDRLNAAVLEAQNATNKAKQRLHNLELKLKTDQEVAISEIGVRFSQEVTEQKIEAENLLLNIGGLEAQARSIVQIIGNIGVTGNYRERADRESGQADLFRWITIAFFAVGILLASINLIKSIGSTIDLSTLVIRFVIALTITIPAFYTARESARHRSNSDQAKQTELELASLNPFLQTLPEHEREKLIAQLTPEYFGKTVSAHEAMNPLEINKVLENIAKITGR